MPCCNSPTVAPVCRRFQKGLTLRRKGKRRTDGNVAALVGLLSVISVDDADDFFDFLGSNSDRVKALPCSAVGANFCRIVKSGKCRNTVIFRTAKRADSWFSDFTFHLLHPLRLNQMQAADASNQNRNHGNPERRFSRRNYSEFPAICPHA